MIKVLIVEDKKLMQEGLKRILHGEKDIEIIDTAWSGEQAIELAEELHPDVILMDLFLPALNGFQATEKIFVQDPSAKIIFVTFFAPAILNDLIRSGAKGFVDKGDLLELADAIRAVYEGNSYYSKIASTKLSNLEPPKMGRSV